MRKQTSNGACNNRITRVLLRGHGKGCTGAFVHVSRTQVVDILRINWFKTEKISVSISVFICIPCGLLVFHVVIFGV